MIWYLDMDGVVVNWTDAAGKLFDIHNLREVYNEVVREAGIKDRYQIHLVISQILGWRLSRETMWDRIDEGGYEWWQTLPGFPWTDSLVDNLQAMGRVIFVTSPPHDANAVKGRLLWLQKKYGRHFRDYMIMPASGKKLLGYQPGSVLIDDYEKTVLNHPGCSILFPQECNRLCHIPDSQKLSWVMTMAHNAFELLSEERVLGSID